MNKTLILASAASIAALLSITTAMAGGAVTSHSHYNASLELMLAQAAEPNNTPQTLATPFTANQLSRKWRLGWAASLGYTFDDQSDVTFDFRYIRTKADGNSGSSTNQWSNDSSWKHQHANLVWGHTFNPIDEFYLRPYVSIVWVNTKNDYTTAVLAGSLVAPYWHSKFNGWGPGFGFTSSYNFGQHFALIGGLVATLPYGPMKTNGYTINGDALADAHSFTTNDKMFQPEAQINLALRYASDLTQREDRTYFGEIGYRAIHIWNAAREMEQSEIAGVVYGNAYFRYGDVTFFGPYLRGGVTFGT